MHINQVNMSFMTYYSVTIVIVIKSATMWLSEHAAGMNKTVLTLFCCYMTPRHWEISSRSIMSSPSRVYRPERDSRPSKIKKPCSLEKAGNTWPSDVESHRRKTASSARAPWNLLDSKHYRWKKPRDDLRALNADVKIGLKCAFKKFFFSKCE